MQSKSMSQQKGRKKLHHYVHDAYLRHWRDPSNAIHVLDVRTGKSFSPTGNGVAAVGGYNDFAFDPLVVDLLQYAFSRRLAGKSPGSDASEIMLWLMRWVKDANYPHKEHNFFEDLYGIYESNISATITQIIRADHEKPEIGGDWGLNLLFLYFLQLTRVPKARNVLAGDFIVTTPEGSTTLDERQKREFILGHMIINALCTACDVYAEGFTVRIRHASNEGKLINSDAPAVMHLSGITCVKDLRGWMPLTPRIVMEIDDVGSGRRTLKIEKIGRDAVDQYNRSMLGNVHTQLYFSSASQRAEYSRRWKRKG